MAAGAEGRGLEDEKGRVEVATRGRKKRGNVTLHFLFSFFTPFLPRSAAAATRNSMLGSAPQLQDAPGVAYLCGDCGELKGGVARKRGDVGDSFFVIARRRPSDASTSLVFFWCPCSSSSASIVPGAQNNDLKLARVGEMDLRSWSVCERP